MSNITEEKRELQGQVSELEKDKMDLVAQLSVKVHLHWNWQLDIQIPGAIWILNSVTSLTLTSQSDEELENLHRQISNLTEENEELRGAYNNKVGLSPLTFSKLDHSPHQYENLFLHLFFSFSFSLYPLYNNL